MRKNMVRTALCISYIVRVSNLFFSYFNVKDENENDIEAEYLGMEENRKDVTLEHWNQRKALDPVQSINISGSNEYKKTVKSTSKIKKKKLTSSILSKGDQKSIREVQNKRRELSPDELSCRLVLFFP
jgi:hypothetical protein